MDLAAHVDSRHQSVLAAMPTDLLDTSDVPAMRLALAELQAMRPAAVPDEVSIDDVEIESADGSSIRVRTYTPDSGRSPSPALLWIHGGGMIVGSVESSDGSCAEIAADLDVVVASVDYRLAPEHPYPTPLEDCYAAMAWLFDNADVSNVDREHIAIGGASAGGGLCAGLALLARDRGEYQPCFQLLTYPMIDDSNTTPSSRAITDPRVWNREANRFGWSAYLSGLDGSEPPIYAAPARATDLTGLPPAIVTVGTLDLFLDEDLTYARRLMQHGVPTDLHVYAGAFHGSRNFVPDSHISIRWKAEELSALDRALNG